MKLDELVIRRIIREEIERDNKIKKLEDEVEMLYQLLLNIDRLIGMSSNEQEKSMLNNEIKFNSDRLRDKNNELLELRK